MKEGKELDFKQDFFEANGVKYYYYGDFSKFGIVRFRRWQALEPVITFGKSFKEIHSTLGSVIKLINESKQVHGHKVLYDLWECIDKNLEDRVDPILEACTLFMVTEDEDLTTYDEIKAREKITNWEKEGISFQSFFHFATAIIPGYIMTCLEISQSSIKKEAKTQKKQSSKGK